MCACILMLAPFTNFASDWSNIHSNVRPLKFSLYCWILSPPPIVALWFHQCLWPWSNHLGAFSEMTAQITIFLLIIILVIVCARDVHFFVQLDHSTRDPSCIYSSSVCVAMAWSSGFANPDIGWPVSWYQWEMAAAFLPASCTHPYHCSQFLCTPQHFTACHYLQAHNIQFPSNFLNHSTPWLPYHVFNLSDIHTYSIP